MAQVNLPISRVIDVSIARETIYPTRDGFGTLLIVTDDATGPLDATTRTKLYSSPDEVAADYATTTEAYKAAEAAFGISPRPLFIKLGFRTAANPVTDELALIEAFDSDWYGLAFTKEMRDHYQITATDQVPLVAAWVEARTKLYVTASNDALTESLADATNISAVLKLTGYDRTATFYDTDADAYGDVKMLARQLRVDYSGRDSAITMKFKRLAGLAPLQKSTGIVQNITGFVPKVGLVDNAGHWANAYVTIGGLDMLVEGNMTSGEWMDTMHFTDWLQNAIAVRVLGLLYNSPKIPYTDVGTQKVVDELQFALLEGVNAGGLAASTDPDTGDYLPPFEIEVDRVSLSPPDRRANRISPVIKFRGRLSGAFHYITIDGTVDV